MANYSTAILKYPSGRFGFVGSVPVALCGKDAQSNVYDTEQEAIDALLEIGITKFQRADCSWYKPEPSYADRADQIKWQNADKERRAREDEKPLTAWQRIDAGKPAPVDVTEDEYYEALEVLPPIYLKGASWFAVGEVKTHNSDNEPVYYCFARIGKKFYGCIGTRIEARLKFEAILDEPLMKGTVKEFEEAAESGQMISLCGLSEAINREGGIA